MRETANPHRRLSLILVGLLFTVPSLAQDLDEANRLAAEGNAAAAIPLYESHLAQNPDDGATWYALGRAAHSLERLDLAKRALRRALELSFQPAGAQLRLGTIALAEGDEAAARNWLQQAFDGGVPVARMITQMPGYGDAARSAEFDEFVRTLHPCGTPENRQFDFWIGDWEVFNPSGRKVGENRIEKILDGCVLAEFWTGAGGSAGRSHNRYDSARKQWVQHWVSDNGSAIDMWGGLVDGAMILETVPTESSPKQRWIWTLEEDGSVRQKAEQLDPETGEWQVIWDSYYRRK
ncbi:MAG: tetratricopeptide repeat protein [Acidobacteria bacterium]|nr:tetratricopeptide repeat protein [Acidobacteriota bacterium]